MRPFPSAVCSLVRFRISRKIRNLIFSRVIWIALPMAVFVAGCSRTDIFQAPARAEPPSLGQSPESLTTLTLVTAIPYDMVRTVIQNQTPQKLDLQGNGHAACAQIPYIDPGGIESHDKCADVPYCDISFTRQVCGTRRQCVKLPDTVRALSVGTHEQCADYNWSATVTAEGVAAVSRSGEAVHLEVPIRIDGNAGLGGTLASILSLSGKNFEAHLKPGVDITFAVGSDWCPTVAVSPTNQWVTSASVEAIGRNCVGFDLGPLGHPEVCAGPINIGLTDQANSAVQAQQGKLTNVASAAFSCSAIRAAVNSHWHAVAIPIPADNSNQTPLFLNVIPRGFAFSGLKVDDDAMRLAVKVWASTNIGPTAADSAPIALPDVSPFDAHDSRLSVGLNATVPYTEVVAALGRAILGKDFSSDTTAGRATVHVDDVTVYPTAKGLAVGVKVEANLPGRVLNTRGWVYLIGHPTVANSGSALAIEDFTYATVIDNHLWQAMVTVFDERIVKTLQSHSNIDLKASITKSAEQLAAQINAFKVKGVKISAQIPTGSLNHIALGKDSLLIAVSANMDFAIELTPDLVALNSSIKNSATPP